MPRADGYSGIVWLASSDAEIGRARSILKALTTPGVLDELGFLVLLGALSDRLYPAINTIMTRARYLVFLPAIFRQIEERQLAKTRSADAVSRRLQFDLRSALLATDPRENGIIGRDAGQSLARPPSNIYWNALSALGICAERTSEAAYLDRLSSGTGQAVVRDDDGIAHPLDNPAFWDRSFRTPHILSERGFYPGTSFDLTLLEARQLKQRYDGILSEGETSLLSHLLSLGTERRGAAVAFSTPWDIPLLPPRLREDVDHARRLSLFARGAQLQYHALLFEKRRTADPGTEAAFAEWWRHARNHLASWDLTAFGNLSCVATSRRQGDIVFLKDWSSAIAAARSPGAAFRHQAARDLLRQRELSVRGPKARLRGGYHLRTWIPKDDYRPSDLYGLFYRHQRGTQFALDIVAGLQRGAAA